MTKLDQRIRAEQRDSSLPPEFQGFLYGTTPAADEPELEWDDALDEFEMGDD